MTVYLLDRLGEARGGLGRELGLGSLALLALPVALLIDAVVALVHGQWERSIASADVAVCPGGHEVGLMGAWDCPRCRLVFEGHAFLPCPHCGAQAQAIGCPCGRVVVNPLSPPRRA